MKIKKLTALILSFALVAGSFNGIGVNKAKAADYGLSNPRVDSEGNVTWDCAYFGSYNQTAQWIKEPIKWRVLSVDENNNAFIVADKSLDYKPYNESRKYATWETSTIRSWLNGYSAASNGDGVDYSADNFLDTAFTEEEQVAISGTDDKVGLLSIDDVHNSEYGFDATGMISGTRAVSNTEYNNLKDSNGNKWWLSTPGTATFMYGASFVMGNGSTNSVGVSVETYMGIRPALHVNLSSTSLWTEAGVMDSEGNDWSSEDNIINNPIVEDGVTTWDCIYFGNYYQNPTYIKEPIKWRVLSVEGNEALFMADKNLDCKPYNETFKDVTWEASTIRSWLNGYEESENNDRIDYQKDNFIDTAFTAQEQAAINVTTVTNKEHEIYGGDDTEDKIYLFSEEEICNIKYGFKNDIRLYDVAKNAKNTDYVKVNDYDKSNAWLLRSFEDGHNSIAVGVVYCNDNIRSQVAYTRPLNDKYYIRPVLHIDLSSSAWKKAGTVSTKSANELIEVEPNKRPMPTKEPGAGDDNTPNQYGLSNPKVDSEGNVTWDCAYFGKNSHSQSKYIVNYNQIFALCLGKHFPYS